MGGPRGLQRCGHRLDSHGRRARRSEDVTGDSVGASIWFVTSIPSRAIGRWGSRLERKKG